MGELPTKGKPESDRRLSEDWLPFTMNLAAVLQELQEDQFLILTLKRASNYVQFAAQGASGMRAETTSMSYLGQAEQLEKSQIVSLVEAGWYPPTGPPDKSTPENDPDGSPNYYRDFAVPVDFDKVAELARHTIADILCVPHPDYLEYVAFDKDGKQLSFPGLGLQNEKRGERSDTHEAMAQEFLDVMREITGIDDLTFDEDGDIAFQGGEIVAFVRLVGDQPQVCIESPFLCDVVESIDLYRTLNKMNAEEAMLRYIYGDGGMLYCRAYVPAFPIIAEHLGQALNHFLGTANELGSRLQAEVGGRLTFSDAITSPTIQ